MRQTVILHGDNLPFPEDAGGKQYFVRGVQYRNRGKIIVCRQYRLEMVK